MSGTSRSKVYYSTSTGFSGQNFPPVAAAKKTVAIAWPQSENNLLQVAMLFTTDVQKGFPAWETQPAGIYLLKTVTADRFLSKKFVVSH